RVLTATLELDDLLRAVLRELAQAVNAQSGSFYFYDKEDRSIRGKVGYGIPDEVVQSIREPIGIFIGLADALAEDRPLVVMRSTPSPEGRRYMEEYGLLSTLVLPLVFKGNPIGVAFVSKTAEPSTFEQDDVDFAMLISRQAAVAVENARLFAEIERTATSEHARREELEAVIDSMEDGVAVIDKEGRISMVNLFGREIMELGRAVPGPIEGQTPEMLDLTYPNGAPIKVADLPPNKALSGHRISGFETIIGAGRGRARILSVSAAPIHDRQGKIAGAAVVYRDVTERRRAERDLQRRNRELQILSEVAGSVARTLDLKQLVEQTADLIMQLLETDALTFYLLDEDTMELNLITHRGVGPQFLKELSTIRVGEMLTGLTAQTGLPLAVEDLQADPRANRTLMAGEGLASYAGVPIKARGKIIGVMPIFTKTKRKFTDRDLALLSAIGNQIGTALENARLYERERDIAETLQESLLGTAPHIPGFEIGVVYEPAFEVAQVGGDFFDFIEFANGKIAIVIGDVSGKGLKAAALTAMAKNTVRAFSYEDSSPRKVLTRTNEVIAEEIGPMEFVTLLYVLLDLKEGVIRMGSAGHPPAFVCDGQCLISVTDQGLPLGAFKDATYSDQVVALQPRQSLILYTDGLTDARYEGKLFGEEGIEKVVGEYKDAVVAQELAERLVRSAREFAGGKLPDDVAIIVLKMRRWPAAKAASQGFLHP
ncbi:MAG: SpoIIE family protein phosphatase, partial [Chloroflexi bacterium]|nr:SpoIIE family protein phosphatase [Chloroflexota bacterium]